MIQKQYAAVGKKVKITFELPGEAAESSIYVVGSFNDWNIAKTPMKLNKKTGFWSASVSVPRDATYEFRYLVDGTDWRNDDSADGYESNPFHSHNSVVKV